MEWQRDFEHCSIDNWEVTTIDSMDNYTPYMSVLISIDSREANIIRVSVFERWIEHNVWYWFSACMYRWSIMASPKSLARKKSVMDLSKHLKSI